MNPAVSVIYVNFNTSALLLHSLRSLISHCREVPFEIVIVDNASEPEQKRLLREGILELEAESTSLVFSDENLGFGRANNHAAKHALAPYLFFLNPDTLIINDVLKIFSEFMNAASKTVAACGGKLLKPDLTPNDSYGNFPGVRQELAMTGLGFRFLMTNYRQHIAIANSAPDKPIKVPYIVGADIFIRRESFDLVEGFDENYFLYYEETDLFRKLKSHSLESYILPDAKIIHFEGAALNQNPGNEFSVSKFRFLLNSKLYYHRKWQPRWKTSLIRGIVLVQIFAQFLKGKMGSRLLPLLSTYFNSRH